MITTRSRLSSLGSVEVCKVVSSTYHFLFPKILTYSFQLLNESGYKLYLSRKFTGTSQTVSEQ